MLSDTSFKIIYEWKAVSEQTLGGVEKVPSKKLKLRSWGLSLPAKVKLIESRCTF